MVILNGFLLKENEIEDEAFEESVITKVMQITPEIQMAVYKGTVYDKTNLLDWLMNKETIMPRLNPRVLTLERNYLDTKVFDATNILDLKYMQNENEAMHPLTLWIVCDPDTALGREFLYEAINFYESSKIGTRLAIILQKSTQNSAQSNDIIKKALFYALNNLKQNKANTFIKKILREKSFNELKQNKKTVSQLDIKETSDINDLDNLIASFEIDSIVKAHDEFLKNYTPFKDSDSLGLFANGWVKKILV